MMVCARLSNNEFGEEDKMRIVEHGLPKKMRDLRNFMLLVSVNGMVQMNALADTRAGVSVFPFSLYKNLRLSDPRPYHSNVPMADNTQAKAMGEVRNVRIQIGYQAYLVDFLVLDILIDKELPLLLGCLFLRTCEAVIDMGRGSLSVQLKNTDWGNEGYGMYKKIEGDGAWHTKFEERIFKSRTKKKAKVKQNQARNGKDKVLSHPSEENTT
ncbi:hypothetical protein Tco_0770686 [Tanacetum coccineum]|uniref:Gag-pol polyprotein n=1 Tax=Tanacetum coccineum TaxID=301880 RepID=A0ABQ4ZD61_9ASTR